MREGGIEEHHVEGTSRQDDTLPKPVDIGLHDGYHRIHTETVDVLLQGRNGRGVLFDEGRPCRPPAEGLQAEGAAAGEEVENGRITYLRSKAVEEGKFHPRLKGPRPPGQEQ